MSNVKGKLIMDLIRDSQVKIDLVLTALESYYDGNSIPLDMILENEYTWYIENREIE